MPDVKPCPFAGPELPFGPTFADVFEDGQSVCIKSRANTLEMTKKIESAAIDHSLLVLPKPISRGSIGNALFNGLLLAGPKITPTRVDQPVHLDARTCEKQLA